LFYAVHELGFDKLSEMTRPVESIEDGFQQLRMRGLIYLKFAFENPELYDLMFIKDAPMHALKNKKLAGIVACTILWHYKKTWRSVSNKALFCQPTSMYCLCQSGLMFMVWYH
jgi:hypothetical protein